jgi:hypothetical protein
VAAFLSSSRLNRGSSLFGAPEGATSNQELKKGDLHEDRETSEKDQQAAGDEDREESSSDPNRLSTSGSI